MAKAERRFVYLLSLAERRVRNRMRSLSGDTTAAQAGVLFLLGQKEGALVGDVAKALGLGLPGASGLVDRTVAAGFVERRPDEHDGRSFRLFLTPLGRTVRLTAITTAAEMNARLTEGFTEKELDVVSRWLTHVNDVFEKEE